MVSLIQIIEACQVYVLAGCGRRTLLNVDDHSFSNRPLRQGNPGLSSH